METADAKPETSARDDPLLLARWLQRVRRRVLAARFVRAVSLDLGVTLGCAAILLLLDRLFLPGLATPSLLAALFAMCLAVSGLRTTLRMPLDLFSISVLADRRLRLQERVSSAVFLAMNGGAAGKSAEVRPGWGELVTDDARHVVNGACLREAFAVRIPRFAAWNSVPLAVCAGLLLWMPSVDLLGVGTRRQARAEMQHAVEQETRELDKKLAELHKKALERKAAEAQKLLGMLRRSMDSDAAKNPALRPEGGHDKGEPKKNALRELTRTEDALKTGLKGKPLASLQQVRKASEKLELRRSRLTRSLQAALKEGSFRKANEALDRVRKELEDLSRKSAAENGLSPEQKARLKELAAEMSGLARKLGASASSGDALARLSKALSRAGASLKMADLPDALDGLESFRDELLSLERLAQDADLLQEALAWVKLTKEQLAALKQCPQCGKPYCPVCGKPRCSCKPGAKPGGT